MRQYRAYLFDSEDHVVAPAMIICAPDDDDAVGLASATFGAFGVEVWRGKRFIKRLPHRELRRARDPT